MKYNDYIKEITRFFNRDFFIDNERLFRNSLRAENCWCPSLAKSTLVDITSARSTVREYYGGLSFLITALLQNKPLGVIKYLERIRSHFQPYGIPLSDLLSRENLFATGCFYYSPATVPEFEEEKRMHFGIFLPGPLDEVFHDDVPEVFRRFEMINLAGRVLDCLVPNIDNSHDAIFKLKEGRWDEVDFPAMEKMIAYNLAHSVPGGTGSAKTTEKTNIIFDKNGYEYFPKLHAVATELHIGESTLKKLKKENDLFKFGLKKYQNASGKVERGYYVAATTKTAMKEYKN